MRIVPGDRLKSRLTGIIYDVKLIDNPFVFLEAEDGSTEEWTKGSLDSVFETMESERPFLAGLGEI